MGQLGIRILNVALFTVCSFQVASVFNDVSADYLRPEPAAVAPAQVAPPPAQPREWNQRKAIIDRNVFDAKTLASFEPEPEPEPENLEETKLPVRLVGTQAHSVRENSKAVLADGSGRNWELLWEGDELSRHDGVQLVRIERRRVVLDNKGRREELRLDEATNEPTQRRPDRSSRRRSRRASNPRNDTPAPIAERLKQLRRDSGGSSRGVGSILSQGRPVPKWEDGQLVGMELRDVEAGGLYERVGLSEGDVITAVNGIQLDNAADASRVLSELSSADSLEIETTNGVINVPEEELIKLMDPE